MFHEEMGPHWTWRARLMVDELSWDVTCVVRRISGRKSHPGLHRVRTNIGKLSQGRAAWQHRALRRLGFIELHPSLPADNGTRRKLHATGVPSEMQPGFTISTSRWVLRSKRSVDLAHP